MIRRGFLGSWKRTALVALAAVGCTICVILSGMGLTARSSIGSALCVPGEHVNCDYVLGSRWARIGPMPAAQLGLAYFGGLFVWHLVVGPPNRLGRYWHLVPLVLTSAGAAASAWFMYVMAAKLPVWCTWCVAIHVVNLFLLIQTIVAWPRACAKERSTASEMLHVAESAYPSATRALGVLGGGVALSVIVLLLGLWLTSSHYAAQYRKELFDATNNVAYIVWKHETADRRDIPLRADDFSEGPADSPHTLVVFSDFECPHCYDVHRMAHDLSTKQFPGRLRFAAKHFPVCKACNPHASLTLHYFACEAAHAAEAARLVGNAGQSRSYRKLLYLNAHRLDERPYAELANLAGIERSAFEEAKQRPECRDRVREDIELGHRLGVEGTPVLFLDGRRLVKWIIVREDQPSETDFDGTLELWRRLLRAESERP